MNKNEGSLEFMRACNSEEKSTLQKLFEDTKSFILHEQNEKEPQTETYWTNLFLLDQYNQYYENLPIKTEVDKFINSLIEEMYQKPVHLVLYGFFISPVNSTTYQTWHYDFDSTFSTIFIPLTKLTSKNSTQFVKQKLKQEMPPSSYFHQDLNVIMQKEGVSHMEISQLTCEPFSILKLYPATLHRGIPNTDDFQRIMFYIGVNSFKMTEIRETLYNKMSESRVLNLLKEKNDMAAKKTDLKNQNNEI